jgi:CxxC-x17-CxxC domain-containing protein
MGSSAGAGRTSANGFGGGAREMYTVTCSECGQQAEVPFQPRGDKPVYCRDCFQRVRSYR